MLVPKSLLIRGINCEKVWCGHTKRMYMITDKFRKNKVVAVRGTAGGAHEVLATLVAALVPGAGAKVPTTAASRRRLRQRSGVHW